MFGNNCYHKSATTESAIKILFKLLQPAAITGFLQSLAQTKRVLIRKKTMTYNIKRNDFSFPFLSFVFRSITRTIRRTFNCIHVAAFVDQQVNW